MDGKTSLFKVYLSAMNKTKNRVHPSPSAEVWWRHNRKQAFIRGQDPTQLTWGTAHQREIMLCLQHTWPQHVPWPTRPEQIFDFYPWCYLLPMRLQITKVMVGIWPLSSNSFSISNHLKWRKSCWHMAGDISELLNPACCFYLKKKSQVFFRFCFLLAVASILIYRPLLSTAQTVTHNWCAWPYILPSVSVSV